MVACFHQSYNYHRVNLHCIVFVLVVNLVNYALGSRLALQHEIRSNTILPQNGTLDSIAAKKSISSTDWDFLTFSLTWPQTFCTLEHDNKDQCQIPTGVDNLTIHGLWPSSKDKSVDPFNCNSTWKFNFTEIEDLKSRLMISWPNLKPDTPLPNLWQHEWEKHGTCGASLDALNSQHNYFKKTLDLKDTYDLLKILQSNGIEPSDSNKYQFDDVLANLTDGLRSKPYLECYCPLEDESVFYISEMRICLDKQFNLIDCVKSKSIFKTGWESNSSVRQRENEPCSSKKPLMIPKIQHG